MDRWEVFRDKAGEWRWHLKADNDEIVAVSEAYTTKEHAQEGVDAAKRAAAEPDSGAAED